MRNFAELCREKREFVETVKSDLCRIHRPFNFDVDCTKEGHKFIYKNDLCNEHNITGAVFVSTYLIILILIFVVYFGFS